jgi:ribosome-associated heat shock protein Hsp15
LWHARVVRTRSAAAALTASGYVRINGHRVLMPGHCVRPGDVVTVSLGRAVRVLKVLQFSQRRGSADDAHRLYEVLEVTAVMPERKPADCPQPQGGTHREMTNEQPPIGWRLGLDDG